VTVPAGSFMTIKIVQQTKEGISTVWYAKGVGRVKTEGPLPGHVIELSSYRLSHAPIVQSRTKEGVDRSPQQTPAPVPQLGPSTPTGIKSIATKIKTRLESAGFGSIKIVESGPQEITL